MENIYHANINQKKARATILIDFRAKKMTRDKEGHQIITEGPIYKEIINVYSSKKEHQNI